MTEEDQTVCRHVDNLMRLLGPGSVIARRQYIELVEASAGYAMRSKVEDHFKYAWETRQAEMQANRARA